MRDQVADADERSKSSLGSERWDLPTRWIHVSPHLPFDQARGLANIKIVWNSAVFAGISKFCDTSKGEGQDLGPVFAKRVNRCRLRRCGSIWKTHYSSSRKIQFASGRCGISRLATMFQYNEGFHVALGNQVLFESPNHNARLQSRAAV
jgi:hypothetical protein